MNEEHSLNPMDGYVMVEHDKRQGYLDSVAEHIETLSDDLRHISLSIHDQPELQYKEYHAHQVLTEYLEKQKGWKVTPSAYDIDTAFIAVYDSGKKGPVVSFNAEYDALVGIGHACGHNLIAISSLGAALATAKIMHDETLAGKVVLFGTPAEEGGGGKIKLYDAGAYSDNDVDVSLMAHPVAVSDAALVRLAAYSGCKVEYFGKEAHAAAAPWDGINALDALITAYNAISVLRQQTKPDDTIQTQITNGGARTNVIHAYAAGRFVIRSTSKANIEALRKKVIACFEAGATATGATLKITWGVYYEDHVPNHTLGRSYRHFFNSLCGDIPPEELDFIRGKMPASSDQGNISHRIPSLHASFWIRSEAQNHNPAFTKAARTTESHELAKRAAKALAATAVDVLTQDGLLEEVKKEFEKMHEE